MTTNKSNNLIKDHNNSQVLGSYMVTWTHLSQFKKTNNNNNKTQFYNMF